MKLNRLLLISIILIMTGCSFFHKEHTLGNKPLVIPTHAGYAKNNRDRRITIFNLDNNEIVGDVSYIYKDEFMGDGDFYVDSDGKIYITMQLTGMNSVGHTIRIINPSTGLEEGAIDVNTAPNKMFDLGNNRILVTSNMILYGDSVIRNVVVDLNQRKVVGNLYTKGFIDEIQESGEDTFDIMLHGLTALGLDEKVYMAHYCPDSDSEISEYREIDNEGIGEAAYFIISNGYYYMYMCRNISLFNPITLKRISVLKTFSSTLGMGKMIKVNDKIYFVRYLSDFNGNDVDSVIVIDDNTHQVIKEIKIPYGGPSDIKYSAYKNRIYVTNSHGETIVEINPETDLVTDTIKTEDESQGDGFNALRLRE
ncbi:MAG: hypothetical protein GWP03_01230 [Proteobacteria bacterium]|nr:hypothetical protein [Pseudomonadota bacterium]